MCGRFTQFMPAQSLQEHFGLAPAPEELLASYNIVPSRKLLVVVEDPVRRLARFHWGLVPSWAKDAGIGSRLINARAETVAQKPAFRSSFRRKRCLIPSNGFYEWKAQGAEKQPFFCGLPGKGLFAFAGLWDVWRPEGEGGEPYYSCTIITTQACDAFKEIHHRMPVILEPGAYSEWLDPADRDPTHLETLLGRRICDLAVYPVSKRVNSPRNDDKGCMEPLA